MKTADIGFYDRVPITRDFLALSDPEQFTPVPDDWIVGVADIVDSTGEIARGRYKTVNMVGAAVISGMINALGGRVFPYVFGGDGAGFAIPKCDADMARERFGVTTGETGAVYTRTGRPFFPDREIVVVADDVVDREFGTGAVKVTPAT